MKEAYFVLLYATRITTSKRASEQQHHINRGLRFSYALRLVLISSSMSSSTTE
jgi:hypothetical protein